MTLFGEVVGNLTESLNFSDFISYPSGIVEFSIFFNESESLRFFKDYVENPQIRWKITTYDYAGIQTLSEEIFSCVEVLDEEAPVINSIETPSIFSEWTGGFDIILNTTDFDSNVIIDLDDWMDNSGSNCVVNDDVTFLTEQYNFKFDDQSDTEICALERDYYNLTNGYFSFRIATTDSDKEFNIQLSEENDVRIKLRIFLGELQSFNGTDWNFVVNITSNTFYFVQISWTDMLNSTYSIWVNESYIGNYDSVSEITDHISSASLSTGITDSNYQIYINRIHYNDIDAENDQNIYTPSGIRYIAVFIDQDPNEIPSQPELFTPFVNSYYGETDPALDNFLGYITENSSDGLYYFNPWEIGEKFAKLTDGEHDFLIVVYDNNYNYAYTEFSAYIIVPELNIESGTLMASSTTDKNLTLELTEYGDQILSVEFEIYDAQTFNLYSDPIDSITIFNSSDVIYRATFSNVLEKEYYINYIISQSDGSTIERFHYCYLPDGILTALSNPSDYWYDNYNLTISDEIPHDVTVSVQEGDIIYGFYDLTIDWLGNSTVEFVYIYLGGDLNYTIGGPFDPNPEGTYTFSFPTDLFADGSYLLSAGVQFSNGQIGISNETQIIIDDSAPVWGDGDGVWLNDISQFSLIDREGDFVQVYTNGDLIINISANDIHTNLTHMNCWVEDIFGDTVWSTSFTDGTEPILDLDLVIDLSSFNDGVFYFYLNISSGGGTISAQPMCIHLDTILPEGEFITPDSYTEFGGDIITLEFDPETSTDSLITQWDMDGYLEYTQNYVPSGERTCTIPFTRQSYHNGIFTYSQETNIYDRTDVIKIGSTDVTGTAYADWGFSLDRDSSVGDVYMVSFDYYLVQGATTPYLTAFYADGYKLPDSTNAVTFGSVETIDLGNGWKRYTRSATINIAGDTWVRFGYGSKTYEVECYVDNFQVELNDHATPFADGIRNEGQNLEISFDYQKGGSNAIYIGSNIWYAYAYTRQISQADYDTEGLLFYHSIQPYISYRGGFGSNNYDPSLVQGKIIDTVRNLRTNNQNLRNAIHPSPSSTTTSSGETVAIEYTGGIIVYEHVDSGKEKKDTKSIIGTKKDAQGNEILKRPGDPDSPIASISMPKHPYEVDKFSCWNQRPRSAHAYDRKRRIKFSFSSILNLIPKTFTSHVSNPPKNIIDPILFIEDSLGYWDHLLFAHGDETVQVTFSETNKMETTLRIADQMLQSQNKPIFYDFLVALKNRGGQITDLVAIERLGGYERGYIETKDWDAGQLLTDKMPMIYIVASPADKLQILRNCQHIGKDFPLMTETEFKWFMIGMHNAYNDPTFDFSLENFVKSLFKDHPNGGKNWKNWGMKNDILNSQPYTTMISRSFGINDDVDHSGEYFGNTHFAWKYTEQSGNVHFVDYTWGSRLQNNYWTFVHESLMESHNFDRKIYDQFFALKDNYVQISHPLPSPYPWMVTYGYT